jgi:hypothetical protein
MTGWMRKHGWGKEMQKMLGLGGTEERSARSVRSERSERSERSQDELSRYSRN